MPLLVLNEGGSLYEWGDIGSSLVRLTTIHACLHDLTGEHSNAPTTPAAALRQLPALASLCRSAIAAACAELEAHTWREVQALAAAADEASKDWGGTGQPMLPRCGQLLVLLATAVPRWVALLESPSRLLGPLLRHAPETAPLGRLQVAQRALADAWGYGMSEAADQMALAQEVVQVVTHAVLTRCRNSSLATCLDLDRVLARSFLTASCDFFEGVTAALIEKGRAPVWRHKSVSDVPPALVVSVIDGSLSSAVCARSPPSRM